MNVGDKLPPVEVSVTTRSVVATAMATRDYQDVHHDPERARKLGTPDIFMNILTSNGYVERYVTLWLAGRGTITSIDVRLGTPNFPGDVMTLTGEVTAPDTIRVTGANARGAHLTAEVKIL